jgi:hypothetical protein
MPVYHETLHAYRSLRADHRRGYTRRGKGYQAPNALNKNINTPGKRWFVRGSSRKRVKDRRHLNHLLDVYLPDHPGIFWRDGSPLPTLP